MIMKQYSHVSIEMTAHYLTLQEEEVKAIYSDMILSPESKIAGLRAKEIKGKLDDLFHGKTEAEIDNVITDLAKTMSFNPLPTGVCLYDLDEVIALMEMAASFITALTISRKFSSIQS